MLNPENVATPATAATTFVPASVPVLGFVPIATVTFPVNPLAVFPCASCAVTCTAGVIAAPAGVLLGCTENTSCVAVPAVMLNAALVALPAPVAVSSEARRVVTIDRLANVASPPTAACVSVPPSVPVPGFVPIATVTFPVNPFAVFPCASCAVTCTAGVITAPAAVVLGSTVNTSWVAVPAVMLNAALVAVPAPVAVSVSPVPSLSLDRFPHVALHAALPILSVPPSVPVPGFVPMATVTFPVNPVAVFPCASCAVTCTAGVITAPAAVVPGPTANTSWVAVPAVMLNAALVALPAPVAVTVSPVPSLSLDRFPHVALHAALPILSVPPSVPVPGFVPMATVTFPVNPVAVFPCASCAVTCTAGVITA